jgi:hypothetical protein
MGYTIYPFVKLEEAEYLQETWKSKKDLKDVLVITSGSLKNEVLPVVQAR